MPDDLASPDAIPKVGTLGAHHYHLGPDDVHFTVYAHLEWTTSNQSFRSTDDLGRLPLSWWNDYPTVRQSDWDSALRRVKDKRGLPMCTLF